MLCTQEEPMKDMFVHCLFVNRLFDFIHPKDVIYAAFDLVLKNHEGIEGLKFGWKFNPSLKNRISNNNFLRNAKVPDCNCNDFKEYCKDFDNLGNHVCTANLNIIKHLKLKKLIGKGLNHIPSEPLNPHLAIAALLQCLTDIASKLQLELDTHNKIAMTIQKIFLEKIDSLPKTWLQIENKTISQELLLELTSLMDVFFIVGLDKAPNNASLICKHLAYLAGLDRLKGNDFCKMSQNPFEASNMIKTSLIRY